MQEAKTTKYRTLYGEGALGDLFVGAITLAGPDEDWTATYHTTGTDIVFKCDPGSQVNIIPETELLRLQVKPVVNTKQRRRLEDYSGEAIAASGT
jgi:hypothetical protein